MEINEKYYENLTIRNSANYDEVIGAMDIVRRYIIREKRILVGGMSIDYALKMLGKKGIYDEDALPDYDMYSPQHHADAYNIVTWLYRKGFRDLSVINALHPSTIKVRVNYVTVADITYIPPEILEHIPTLKYRGFRIIHPHVQMIDQHRALSFPYENAPRETILSSRPRKDMKRYDLLYESYPLRMLNIDDPHIKLRQYHMSNEIITGQCITGFVALNYWLECAKKLGFKSKDNFGFVRFDKEKLEYLIPIDSHGLTLYSDNMGELFNVIKQIYKPKETRFYKRFLDKLPRKVIIDNELEILENKQKIAAHKVGSLHIANMQNIMMYLLVNYILLMRIKKMKRGFSFFQGYLTCRNLIAWAAEKYYATTHADTRAQLKLFLPTAETYGAQNWSESYVLSKYKFDLKNRIEHVKPGQYEQPRHVYDRDLNRNYLPKSFYKFDPKTSELFHFDGSQTKDFLSISKIKN